MSTGLLANSGLMEWNSAAWEGQGQGQGGSVWATAPNALGTPRAHCFEKGLPRHSCDAVTLGPPAAQLCARTALLAVNQVLHSSPKPSW